MADTNSRIGRGGRARTSVYKLSDRESEIAGSALAVRDLAAVAVGRALRIEVLLGTEPADRERPARGMKLEDVGVVFLQDDPAINIVAFS